MKYKKSVYNDLRELCPSTLCNVAMKNYTSLKIGGPCDFFVEPEDLEQLTNVLSYANKNNIPYFILGNGTNILVSDKGIRGIVIRCKKFNKITLQDNKITAEAGVNLSNILRIATKSNLSGFEFSYGIPGSCGGAIKTNAGTDMGCIGDVVESIEILDKEGKRKEVKNVLSLYRKPLVKKEAIILSATFKLKDGHKKEIKEKIDYLKEKRRTTQPYGVKSCGCVFKNSKDFSAGYLIEKVGAKGLKCGDAIVSSKHANFIINRKNATASDFLSLAQKVKKMVQEKFGIKLSFEIELVGEF